MTCPILLPEIDPIELTHLYNLLQSINLPIASNGRGRSKSFGVHRAMTLGFIKARFSRKYGLSYYSRLFPEIYTEVCRIGNIICPFEFSAIHINHNVVCPRHIDGNNVGKSVIVSIGDYDGGLLMIDGEGEFDTNCKPLMFDGSKIYHWNTPLLSGDKYSLVFFHNPS